MRRDASRNHELILTSAIAVLADSPHASMREIADASGTGRTTLYRHFPDRQALVEAIYERVLAEADGITLRFLECSGDPVEVIAALSAELAGLGDRYRFLEQHFRGAPSTDPEQMRESGVRLLEYVAAAQRDGRVRRDLDADWLLSAVVALVTRAAGHRFTGSSTRAEVVRATVESLLLPPER
jgi:AcrR family transcriptional regulator